MAVINYRDYGTIPGMAAAAAIPVELPVTLVYQATHRGNLRLSYRERSFISFTFGGRYIEDFNLIATIDGDRMSRNLSAAFEHLTTNSEVLNGLFYHGTYYKANELHLTLSTDGIDLLMLEDFKNWFSGGKTRELILAEHPNRAIMARVALAPIMNMIPFEKEISVDITGIPYSTSITEYKGDITLDFVMDEPFWYSKVNLFGQLENGIYIDKWEGVEIFNGTADANDKLKDVLKMIYEDGIPISNMISESLLLGGDVYAASSRDKISSVCMAIDVTEYNAANGAAGYYNNGDTIKSQNSGVIEYNFPNDDNPDDSSLYHKYYMGAVIEGTDVVVGTKGVIFGPYITNIAEDGMTFATGIGQAINLYYAGTAPAPVILKFTVPIQLDNNGYISTIASKYHKVNDHAYNSIFLLSTSLLEMRFTTPSFLTSYNKVIEIFSGNISSLPWEKLREKIRNNIRHATVRALAIHIINNNEIGAIVGNTPLLVAMKNVFSNNECKLSVELNSKTGEAVGKIKYYDIKNNILAELKENIGDMVNSNYLMLEDRNYFDKNTYLIMSWKENAPANAYRMYHDFPIDLNNFSIQYKYMYY